jgi:pimeloyl-ACP methyl ester carboxylesterase
MRLARVVGLTLGALLAVHVPELQAADQAISKETSFSGLVAIDGGRKLYLDCQGQGRPTVILEAGLRNRGDIWSVKPDQGEAVLPAVANFTKVCAYDRPGTTLGTDQFSRSDPVPQPRTAADAIADLHDLLKAADISPPYVLVGHSTGGLMIRLFASTYPGEVAGLVLVDAISEGVKAAMTPAEWAAYDRLILVQAPKQIAAYKDLETIDFDKSFGEIKSASPLRPMPLIVISKGKPFALPSDLPEGMPAMVEVAWNAGQSYLAGLLPDTPHLTAAHSGHYIEIEQPQMVIDAIKHVVDEVRAEATRE